MEKIKQILMQNSLYKSDEIIKPANYNKIEEFLNTYEYNGSRKQKLPNNLSRDDDGRIILEEIPFIKTNVTPNGDRDNEWLILNNGTKLLTKAGREHKYNIDELVIMYFLKSINIDCANYDIATLNDKELLIVPSFLQDNEKIKTTFQKVPDIEEAYQEMKSSNARTFFLKTIFADRIYGNVERFPVNFGNIISIHPNKETHERICPLFDNATKYGLFFRENKYFNFPSIGPKNDSAFDKVINHLLGYEEIMHWMHGPVKKATLYKATERLYKEKGIYVDNDIYKEFETFFKDSEAIINDELKNKGTSLKIKLV